MILLIEPDETIRKKLCDLLSRERIVGVGSIPETLEMICKFKNNFDIIIVNIRLLNEIFAKGTLFRLCDKLYIKVPPILGIYNKSDAEVVKQLKKIHEKCEFIEYDKENSRFPEQYIQAIKELFPQLIVDINKAKESWVIKKKHEEQVDPHAWLEQEGFLKTAKGISEKTIEKHEEKQKKEKDYKSMYFDIKKKYDELVKYVKELADSTKNP